MTTLDPVVRIEPDQHVLLRGLSWADYERLLDTRAESAVPRMTYLEGDLELMSPSLSHEWIKKTIARLVETWSEESGIDLSGYGSWTVKDKSRERGLEPDECYVLGDVPKPRPDLAIEVVISSGSIDKLEVYRQLGIPEVWFWRRSGFSVHVLRGDRYAEAPRSELLPTLDLALLARFVDHTNQAKAVRDYRGVLRAMRHPG